MTSVTPNKVADDMPVRQSAVIEFLVKEDIPAAEIHQRLQHAYGSVSWVQHPEVYLDTSSWENLQSD
jgi:hypothetical protein